MKRTRMRYLGAGKWTYLFMGLFLLPYIFVMINIWGGAYYLVVKLFALLLLPATVFVTLAWVWDATLAVVDFDEQKRRFPLGISFGEAQARPDNFLTADGKSLRPGILWMPWYAAGIFVPDGFEPEQLLQRRSRRAALLHSGVYVLYLAVFCRHIVVNGYGDLFSRLVLTAICSALLALTAVNFFEKRLTRELYGTEKRPMFISRAE